MPLPTYAERVEKGVEYLDATYPSWWTKVDVAKISIWSPISHIVAQIRHELYYETPEFVRRAPAWQHERGFELYHKGEDWVELNAAWMLRVRDIQFERASTATKGGAK